MLANDIRNYRMMDDYIAHHGILGQKWGDKNGPPYPLGSGDHSSAEKKAASAAGVKVGKDSGKGDINNVKNKPKQNPLEKMKTDKQRKQALEKAREAKAKKAEEKAAAEAHEAERKKALDSGDYKEIQKYANESSYEELQRAVNKANVMQQLNQKVVDSTPVEKDIWNKLDDASNKINTAVNFADKTKDVWNRFANVYNTFADPDGQLPVIGTNWAEEKEKRAKEKAEKERAETVANLTKKADPNTILKNKELFSNKEYQEAKKRVDDENALIAEKEKREKAAEDAKNKKKNDAAAAKEANKKEAEEAAENLRKANVDAMTRRADPNEIYENRKIFTDAEFRNAWDRFTTDSNFSSKRTKSKPAYEDSDFPDDDNYFSKSSASKAQSTMDDIWEVVDNPKSNKASNSSWNGLMLTQIWDID